MPFIQKPEDIHVDVIHKETGVGIRITSGDNIRDLSVELASYLATEIAAAVLLATEVRNGGTVPLETEASPVRAAARLRRANEAMLKWHRHGKSDYIAEAAGMTLRVFAEGRSRWFAQVGHVVLNPEAPMTSKGAAVSVAENSVISH